MSIFFAVQVMTFLLLCKDAESSRVSGITGELIAAVMFPRVARRSPGNAVVIVVSCSLQCSRSKCTAAALKAAAAVIVAINYRCHSTPIVSRSPLSVLICFLCFVIALKLVSFVASNMLCCMYSHGITVNCIIEQRNAY